MLHQDLINGGTLGDAGHQVTPGGLDNFYTHVVRQVLDEVQHLLAETKCRVVNFELIAGQKLSLLVGDPDSREQSLNMLAVEEMCVAP